MFCFLRPSNKTSFPVFSDARHSETRISCFLVGFPAKEHMWMKKWYLAMRLFNLFPLTPILKMESDEIIQWLNYIMLSFSFNILMSFVKIFEFQILIACC